MRRCLLLSSGVALLATPALADPWVRSYVVTRYEPAWHFGGSASFHKAGVMQPGSDCPKGSFPELDYSKVLLTPWRDAKVVDNLLHPPHTDSTIVMRLQGRALTNRGFRDGIDVYINPFSAPDPGMQEVTGKIAEGFDLDGDAKTGGFTSPEGQKGIDNAYYRALGCLSGFRDFPYHANLSNRSNDEMAVENLFTFVIRVTGNKDPMNDNDATVEIGFSPDPIVLGAAGNVLSDYSFRLVKNEEYSKLRATVKNGVVETEQADELHAPRIAWFPNQYGDADFHKGRLRIVIGADGDVSGHIGGYRDWRELFVEDHFAQAGGAGVEIRDHQNAMGMYYALKRNADGMPDPKTGKNMGISIAYRFQALRAFVVDSTKSARTTIAMTDEVKREIKQMQAHREAFFTAVDTKQIQPTPNEGRVARNNLQQQPDGSWKVVAAPKGAKAPAAPPKKPDLNKDGAKQQQVLNAIETVVSSDQVH